MWSKINLKERLKCFLIPYNVFFKANGGSGNGGGGRIALVQESAVFDYDFDGDVQVNGDGTGGAGNLHFLLKTQLCTSFLVKYYKSSSNFFVTSF